MAGLVVLGTVLASVIVARGRFLHQRAAADRQLRVVEAAVGSIYRGSATEPDANAYKALAFVTSGTAFRHDASRIPAGSKVKYRVRAKRGDVMSGYSNEVLIVAR